MQKKRVVIFCRVSSDSQDFQRQVLDLTEFAAKANYNVVETITEKISGTKANKDRVGVQELLASVRSKNIEQVMVSEISRLGRSTMETLKLIEEIHSHGVSIYMADLNMSTLDENGKPNLQSEIILHLLSILNQEWVRQHSARVRSGQKRAKHRGVRFGRPEGSESSGKFLAKHKQLVQSFKRGERLSLRKRAELYGVSVNTVSKVKSLL